MNPIHHCNKKNEIAKNKPTQGDKRPVLQKGQMLMNLKKTNIWKDIPCLNDYITLGTNECLENDYVTQGNLQTQCNPYKITKGIFHRNETKILKFVWRHKAP